MATINLGQLCLDALGKEFLCVRIESEIFRAKNIPARLVVPGGDFGRSIEGNMIDGHLVGRQVLADLLGQIASHGAWEDGGIDRQIAFGVGSDGLDARRGRTTRGQRGNRLPFSGANADT